MNLFENLQLMKESEESSNNHKYYWGNFDEDPTGKNCWYGQYIDTKKLVHNVIFEFPSLDKSEAEKKFDEIITEPYIDMYVIDNCKINDDKFKRCIDRGYTFIASNE